MRTPIISLIFFCSATFGQENHQPKGRILLFAKRIPLYPEWLRGANETTKVEVARIAAEKDLSPEEKEDKLQFLLKNESEIVQEAYKVHNAKETLVIAAQRKVDEIRKDKSVSGKNQRRQIKIVIDSLPKDLRGRIQTRGPLALSPPSPPPAVNPVAEKIREVGRQIGELQEGLMDGFRAAAGPMRRLKFPVKNQQQTKVEAKSIQVSEDGEFIQV